MNTGPTPYTSGPGPSTLAMDSEWDNVDPQYVNPVTNPYLCGPLCQGQYADVC